LASEALVDLSGKIIGKAARGTATTFFTNRGKEQRQIMRIGERMYMLYKKKHFPVIVPETLQLRFPETGWTPANNDQVNAFIQFCYPGMSDDKLSIDPSTIPYPSQEEHFHFGEEKK